MSKLCDNKWCVDKLCEDKSRPLRPKRATGASPMPYVPRLPHKVAVDVTKCHAGHMKRRWMSQSATPAKPTAAAPEPATPAQARHWSQPNATRATPATQSEGPCHQVPRPPHETKVDVTKYHVCHMKRRWVSQSATPAKPTAAAPEPATPAQARHRSQPSAIRATPATQSGSRCHQVPRRPRETKVDVTKYHVCHMKRRWMSQSATPATPIAVMPEPATPAQARHRSQPKAIRATPATQSGSRCHQVPRRPRERWMSSSTTPAT